MPASQRIAAFAVLFLCVLPVLHAQSLPFYPAPGSPFTFTTLPGYLGVGDFNGDGNPDVLIGNSTLLLGDGHGKFTRTIGPPFPPRGFAIVADFNNDGRSDVAIVSATLPLMVYLGNRDGTFTLAPTTLNILGFYAVGDFNGDGNLDLLASGPRSLVLLLGDGRGGFTASTTNLPTNIGSVQVADFNGDGHLDLVVGVIDTEVTAVTGTLGKEGLNVTILLGDGRGNFTAAASSYRFKATSVDITVGDFNGDGKPDVAVHYVDLPLGLFFGAGGTVLLGDGAGGLKFASNLPGIDTYSHFIVSDFNGDGKQDLAVWSGFRSSVSILLGDGMGNFTNAPGSPYNTGLFPAVIDVVAADFNKDGRPDLAVFGNETFATFALLLNGVGSISTNPAQVTFNAGVGQSPPAPIAVTVTSPTTPVSTFSIKTDQPWLIANPSVGATGAAVAVNVSVNTNGLTAGTYHGTLSITSPNFLDGSLAVTLTISNPSNGLTPAAHSIVNTGRAPAALALADFNGDGNLDLAVGNSLDNTITVLIGDGSGNFTAQAYGALVTVPAGSTSLKVADLNGDGRPDLIVSGTQSTAVLLNTGTGLAAAPGSPLPIVGPVAVADFDGNGTFDIAYTFAINTLDPIALVYALLGDGTGGFIFTGGGSGGPASAAVAGDFNGDGRPDVAVIVNNSFGSFTQVFLNGGGGSFTPATEIKLPAGVSVTAAAAGDFNGDGKLDLAIVASGTVLVLLGDGKGNFNSPITLLPLAASTGLQEIAVADVNGDGKLDIVVVNSAGVTMFLGDGAGGFAAAPGGPVSVGLQSGSVVVGDLNHDGVPDLVVGNLGGNNVSVFLGSLRNSTTPFRLSAQRISISPLALTFFQSASQSISISGAAIVFNATVTSGGNWLQVSPATGLSPATVTASVNTAGLTPGSYNGQIAIAFNDGTPSQTVSVTLNIAAPAQIAVSSTFLQFTAERGSSPPPQNLQVTFDGAFTATVQGNAPWLTVLQANASNLLILVNPAGLANGVYEAVLAISAPGASTALVRVRMTVQDGPQFLLSTKPLTFTFQMGGPGPAVQTVSVNATGRHFNFTAASSQPWLAVTPQAAMTPVFLNLTVSTAGMKPGVYDATVMLSSPDATNSPQSFAVRLIIQASAPIPTVSSVLNAATLAAGPLAPGSLFTIMGTNLAAASITFGGVAAPILYVSPTQINGQVPFEVGLGQTMIVVGNAGTIAATIASIAPGLFQTATGRAAILNQDGAVNDVSNPAAPNSIVSAFLTGQGAVDPPVATGSQAPINPFSRTSAEVAATFDRQSPAEVVFAGLAPTLVGVFQVNLRVPMLPAGDHTLVVSIGGIPSNPAPVAIAPTL